MYKYKTFANYSNEYLFGADLLLKNNFKLLLVLIMVCFLFQVSGYLFALFYEKNDNELEIENIYSSFGDTDAQYIKIILKKRLN
jgi:hypothetical protein